MAEVRTGEAEQRGASSAHDELDQLEAEREVELAEKPWLASDSEAPTFDEARARIECEVEGATPTGRG